MRAVSKKEIVLKLSSVTLLGNLQVPENAQGLIIFAHGSGSSRLSPRNINVADQLANQQFATLLFDLLTETENQDYYKRFDIELLTKRLIEVTLWTKTQDNINALPNAYFGASTGAAAALNAAAQIPNEIWAVVSRGGRPDLATESFENIKAPILLIVGGEDKDVLQLNREVFNKLKGEKNLQIVPGAGHLFEEPGAMDQVIMLSIFWFKKYLSSNNK